MRQLRKVFMTVRLMKADEVQGGKKGSAPCYAQWRRSPCENCVARQALEKNTRKTRLEYFGQELYEITASCVQVDGQLCVLELTRKIDRSVLLDPENGERLLNSITDEREKRYRDPLTGAYNRTYYDENYRYRSITARCGDAGYGRSEVLQRCLRLRCRQQRAGNGGKHHPARPFGKDRLIRYDGGRLLLLLPDIRQEQLSPRLEQYPSAAAGGQRAGLLPHPHVSQHWRRVDQRRKCGRCGAARGTADALCTHPERHRDHRASAGAARPAAHP